MTTPPQQQPPPSYVIIKPGGLSGAAHAVHILIAVLTCGLWLPVYLVIAILAAVGGPKREYMTPYTPGQPAQPVARPSPPVSPARHAAITKRNRIIGIAIAVAFVAVVLTSIIVDATR